MDPRIGGAIGLVVALIIFSTPLIPIEEVVINYTPEPYSFEQKLVREKQVRPFPWFSEVTQTQHLLKNTDSDDGKFALNYLFDNGLESKTKTKKVEILAGEEKSVTVNSPLSGKSIVSLNIIPPYRSVAQQEVITKKVNAWHFINPLKFLFK